MFPSVVMAEPSPESDAPRPLKRLKTLSSTEVSAVSPQLDQEDSKLSAFLGWCLKGPSPLHINSKVCVGKTGSCAGYGMSSLVDILAGEELFRIPQSRIIVWETMLVGRDDERRMAVEDIAIKSRWAPLILSVMVEWKKPNSFWHSYLDLFLQDSCLDLPLFWDATSQELLQGTYIKARIAKDRSQIEKDFSELVFPFLLKYHHVSPSAHAALLEDAFKICGFIMSYSFTKPESARLPSVDKENSESGEDEEATTAGNALAEVPMMIPMADILNASISKNNAKLHWGENDGEELCMIATKDIREGEEVFNTYGEISNEEMLYLYGYAENDEKNPHEEVFIRCQHVYEVCKGMIERQELPLAVAELDARWELLTNRKMVGEDLPVVLGRSEVLTDSELRIIVDVLKMDEEEFDTYSENAEEVEEGETDGPTFTLDNLPSLDTTVKAIFLRVLQRKTEEYPRNLSEEKQHLQRILVENCSDVFSKRERWCSFVRHAQLLLLQEYFSHLQ